MADGSLTSSSVKKLLFILFFISFTDQNIRNGRSVTQMSIETAIYSTRSQYMKIPLRTLFVHRSVSCCHLGFIFMKDYNPFRCKRKFSNSKFRYYSNTDAAFNIETNPGPSLSSNTSTDNPYINATSNWSDSPKIVNALPKNYLYHHRQLRHNPLNCIGISSSSRCSEKSTSQLTSSQPSLSLCTMNVRSIKNKSAVFVHYVNSCKADLFALTETWLGKNDDAHRAEITPTGFKLIDLSRNDRRGGGRALLFKENLNIEKTAAEELRSFEYLQLIVSSGTFKVRVAVLYRPLYSPAHPVTTSTFFTDFADYLETLILSSEQLLITSDFNVHVDDSTNPDAPKLLDLLDSLGLCQHVTQSTHELGTQ